MSAKTKLKEAPELFAEPKAQAVHKPLTVKSSKTTRGQEIVVRQPQPPAQPKTLLQVIAEAASSPAVDVQKMKELLAIKREEEALIAEREFNVALAEAQSEMPRITRDAKSDKHRYVRLETVAKALDPIIARHNFSLSFGMSDSPLDQHYRITATLAHKSGHKREYFIDLPADTKGAKGNDNKTPVQGIGSTISYGRRYLVLMIMNIAVTNEDDDGQGGKPDSRITEAQADELLRICADKNLSLALFQKAFRVNAIADLPAKRFEEAKERLSKAPKQEKKEAAE